MYNVLVDSCVWIAYLDPERNPAEAAHANAIFELLEENYLVVPIPTLYEFVNSRLSRRSQRATFDRIFNGENVKQIGDEDFREHALRKFSELAALNNVGDVSLVDEIIKLVLVKERINFFATFDKALANYATSRGIQVVSY